MGDIAIKIEDISKRYVIGKQKDGSLRGTLGSLFNSSSPSTEEEFWALKDVSFEVKKGEAIGIIGKNGAGKSTLLKILSQITKPTTGRIELNGRVASLLEVGTGFHPELTGRENIYLNGTILGMSRKEVKAKFDKIVTFSGVEKFIDTPVKHYSSGMYVRLAFAVAAHLEPEILIIDEVLAVGDAEFQKKCLGKMKDIAGEGRTVLFVSHNMNAIKNLCNKAILIKKGEIDSQGETNKILSKYLTNDYNRNKVFDYTLLNERSGSGLVLIQKIYFKNNSSELTETLSIGESFDIIIEYKTTSKYIINQPLDVKIGIFDQVGNRLSLLWSESNNSHWKIRQKEGEIVCKVANPPLYIGKYFFNVALRVNYELQDWIINAGNLSIIDDTTGKLTKNLPPSEIFSITLNQEWNIY